eukprot:scaffold515941_cov157-Attheya_sp.AAC.1
MLLKFNGHGQQYLLSILADVQAFNRLQKGFVFCIMSGTNVRDLHDVLRVASNGIAPLEIPLPLLRDVHVLGGVPRYIEVLVFLLGSNLEREFDPQTYLSHLTNPPQPHELLEKIRTVIG